MLEVADAVFPNSLSRPLRASRLSIAYERALHRRELLRAKELAGLLAALASPTDETDIDIR